MVRAMAKEAEATREKMAAIIRAEGELQAAQKLNEAANLLQKQPGLLSYLFVFFILFYFFCETAYFYFYDFFLFVFFFANFRIKLTFFTQNRNKTKHVLTNAKKKIKKKMKYLKSGN